MIFGLVQREDLKKGEESCSQRDLRRARPKSLDIDWFPPEATDFFSFLFRKPFSKSEAAFYESLL